MFCNTQNTGSISASLCLAASGSFTTGELDPVGGEPVTVPCPRGTKCDKNLELYYNNYSSVYWSISNSSIVLVLGVDV